MIPNVFQALRAEIRKTRTLTSKPFGVNISFLPAAKPPDYASYIRVIIEEGVKARITLSSFDYSHS